MPYRRRVAADATSAAASCAAAPRCCALRLPQPIQRRARSARAAPRGGGQRAAQQRVFLLQAVVLNAQVEHHALLPRLRTMAAVRARSGAHARFQHHGMQRAFICLLLAMRATSRPSHRVSACPRTSRLLPASASLASAACPAAAPRRAVGASLPLKRSSSSTSAACRGATREEGGEGRGTAPRVSKRDAWFRRPGSAWCVF